MKDLILQIDYRERTLLQHLEKLEKAVNDEKRLVYTVCNLPVGDFIIRNRETDDILLIIERKTWNDLESSIKDGRFRQQKQRIDECGVNTDNVVYILEGKCNTSLANQTMLWGAVVNMLFRHKYKVLPTENVECSAKVLQIMYNKIKSDEFSKELLEVSQVKLLSKSQRANQNHLASQLSTIKGVSYSTALIITKTYSTTKDLVEAFLKCDEQKRPFLLSPVQLQSGKSIGKALSKKIHDAIMLS